MTIAMTHRGPDEAGHLRQTGVALGMRRLRIIDLAGSQQPLSNEDGRVSTVFNGEIFNFRELRRELQQRGHRLASRGDTEVIVHLYEEHGPEFPRRLRGMFAIAVWDSTERKLVLARDRLGVKPLYYAVTPHGLAFASEIKCLIAANLIEPVLDVEAAELFLALGYVPGPRTLFAGVLKLPPAAILEWRAGSSRGPTQYWSPLDPHTYAAGTQAEDEAHLRELLGDAVHSQLVSDVPVGLMLSGGLDSSLVAALMAEATSDPIETFSIGFTEDAAADELAWARATATRLGTNHRELLTSSSEHADLLDEALWHLEEPIADLSFLGFLLLCRLAREHVTVALCGQAADELLGGYAKHRAARVADLAASVSPTSLRRSLKLVASPLDERGAVSRLLRVTATDDDIERMLAMSRIIPSRARDQLAGPVLIGPDVLSSLQNSFGGRVQLPATSSRLTRTLLLDLQLALPDLMFLYFDKMSMAASLEVRVPFADHDLVTFCMGLCDARRIRRLRGKEILRRVSRGQVDDTIIERPKRGFFRAASSSWLHHQKDTVRETLLDRRCIDRGVLDHTTIQRWINERELHGREGEPLLIAFLLERWHRQFVDSDGLAHERARANRRAAAEVSNDQPITSS